MNLIEIEKQLSLSRALNDKHQIQKIFQKLSDQQVKMDRWFDKYLDIFSEKIGEESKNPAKILYKKKFDEYNKVNRLISISKYYLTTQKV